MDLPAVPDGVTCNPWTDELYGYPTDEPLKLRVPVLAGHTSYPVGFSCVPSPSDAGTDSGTEDLRTSAVTGEAGATIQICISAAGRRSHRQVVKPCVPLVSRHVPSLHSSSMRQSWCAYALQSLAHAPPAVGPPNVAQHNSPAGQSVRSSQGME